MAREEVVGDWMASRKVFTGVIHGPRCTLLTWLRTPTHNEEGG
jgi:hypothetical protein